MEVAGDAIVLRAWREDDAPRLTEACADPLIARWIPLVPSPYTLDDARTYIAECLVSPARGRGAFAIADERVGLLGAIDVRINAMGTGHVGYWVAPWGRGRGVCTDALVTVSRWAFAEHGLGRLELIVDPANPASLRVAEKAGYVREGVLRSALAYRDGRRADAVMLSLLPADA